LARQRILRCRPVRGLFYKACVDQSQRVRLTPTNDNLDLDYGVWIVLHWKAWPPMYVITSGQGTVRAVIMRHACWVATLKYRTDNLRCLSAKEDRSFGRFSYGTIDPYSESQNEHFARPDIPMFAYYLGCREKCWISSAR
jgi:hypothetical protein